MARKSPIENKKDREGSAAEEAKESPADEKMEKAKMPSKKSPKMGKRY